MCAMVPSSAEIQTVILAETYVGIPRARVIASVCAEQKARGIAQFCVRIMAVPVSAA